MKFELKWDFLLPLAYATASVGQTGGNSTTGIKLRRDTGGNFVFIRCVDALSILIELPGREASMGHYQEEKGCAKTALQEPIL